MAAFLTKIALVLTVAFLVAAAGTLFLDIDADKRSELMQEAIDNPLNTSSAGIKTILGYDLTTPYWEFEWTGDPDKKTFMLEQIPYPDSRDLLILIPYWFIAFLIVRFMFKAENISNWWAVGFAFFFFTIGTFMIWILWKMLWFNLLLNGSRELGIEQAMLEARSKVSGTAGKAAFWIIAITIFNSIVLFRALWPGGGDD